MRNATSILGTFALLSMATAACSPATPRAADTTAPAAVMPAAASTDHPADAAMILASDSAWLRHVTAQNLDSLMTFYAPEVVSYGFGPPATGFDKVKAMYAEMLKGKMSNPMVTSTPAQFSPDGLMAYDHGIFKATMTAPGGKPETSSSAYLNVWRKMDGKWKLVAEMSVPLADTKKM